MKIVSVCKIFSSSPSLIVFLLLFLRTAPSPISITPDTTLGGDFSLHQLGSSSCSLSTDAAGAANVHASVFLPGSVQAAAMGTLCLPGAVTVQASAVAELNSTTSSGNTRVPAVRDETGQRRNVRLNTANMSAASNIDASNALGNGYLNSDAGVQVHLAGTSSSDESKVKDRPWQLPSKPSKRRVRQHKDCRSKRRRDCFCEESLDSKEEYRISRRHRSMRNRPNSSPRCKHNRRTEHSKPYPTQNASGYHNSANCCSSTERVSPEISSTPNASTPPGSTVSLGCESLHNQTPSPRPVVTESRASSLSRWKNMRTKLAGFSLTYFAKAHYGPWLQKFPVKVRYLPLWF